MKWKIKGALVLIILAINFQSCSRNACKGGMCPVFSDIEMDCQNENQSEIKGIRVGRA